jgi:hypothetical protein
VLFFKVNGEKATNRAGNFDKAETVFQETKQSENDEAVRKKGGPPDDLRVDSNQGQRLGNVRGQHAHKRRAGENSRGPAEKSEKGCWRKRYRRK